MYYVYEGLTKVDVEKNIENRKKGIAQIEEMLADLMRQEKELWKLLAVAKNNLAVYEHCMQDLLK